MSETASTTPSLGGQVWLKSVRYPFLNQAVTLDDVQPVEREARAELLPVHGRTPPVGVLDLRGSRQYTLSLLTKTTDARAKLDLSLLVGEVFFLHVPTTRPILPGSMYVMVGTVTSHRVDRKLPVAAVDPWYRFVLPLVEVAQPGPDVVGGTLTWETVRRLYGSWEAVWAAHDSFRELWATIGSPEDLVVL
jgi:hypothetical protein